LFMWKAIILNSGIERVGLQWWLTKRLPVL